MAISITGPLLIGITLLFVAFRRWRGDAWREALGKVGLRGTEPRYIIYGLAIAAALASLFWVVFRFFTPMDSLSGPNVSQSNYADWERTAANVGRVLLLEAFTVTLGEELFFRGLLGGALMRRFGFQIGNLLQSLIFLLPHLLLLTVSLRLAGVVAMQWASGWLMGWLFWRSKSILPGWLAHTLMNTLSAVSLMG